jgi:oxalate decarboxylase
LTMTDLSKRKVLVGATASGAAVGVAATGKAVSSGNPDRPPEGQINAKRPTSMSDPCAQNPTLAGQFPSFENPPATDVNGMPLVWTSFDNAHTRCQNGGWAGEVTQDDFAISEDISGVSMRLAANGVREMHWHQQAKWAIMMDGKALSGSRGDHGRLRDGEKKIA